MRGRYPRHCRNQRSERFGDESFIRQGPILIQVGATESTPICTKNVPTTVRHQPIARLTRKRPQSTSLPWRCQARGSGRDAHASTAVRSRWPAFEATRQHLPSSLAGHLHATSVRACSARAFSSVANSDESTNPSRPAAVANALAHGPRHSRVVGSASGADPPPHSQAGQAPQRRATAGSNRGGSNPCTPVATNSLAA